MKSSITNSWNSSIDRALAISGDELVELTEEICCEAEARQPGAILKARCIPYIDRAGRNVGTITVLHDITALKRMDQIKSEFVSMGPHEIRSPLNSASAQMKIIQDGLAGEVTPRQQEILGRASEKVKGLVSLSSELLDLARIESGLINQEKSRSTWAISWLIRWPFRPQSSGQGDFAGVGASTRACSRVC